jgi:hypothetical protein
MSTARRGPNSLYTDCISLTNHFSKASDLAERV